MALRHSKGVPGILKVVIGGNLSGKKLETVVVEDGLATAVFLPDSENEIFSMNSAALHLLGLECTEEMDQWLEWDSAYLQPLVHLHLVNFFSKREDAETKAALVSGLERLEKSFLSNSSVQSLYPIVWCTLYPLVTCNAIKDFEATFAKVSKWFKDLAAHPGYSKSVKSLFPKDAAAMMKESMTKMAVPDFSLSSAAAAAEPAAPAGPSDEDKESAYTAWCGEQSKTLPDRQHPVLPKEGAKNLLITSALPYVNNVPHLGNIVGCVLSGDVFSRYCRLREYNCVYVGGTDEYGTATETKALQEGLTPKQICDKYYALHAEIYKWFNIDFDVFGRTTTDHQTKISQGIFWQVYNKGYILKDSVEQLRCEKCERFLADRFVEGTCPLCGYEDARGDQCDKCGKLINAVDLINPKCKLCKSSPVVKSSEHLFLDLPKLETKLTDYLDKQYDTGTWTHNAKLITKAWLRDGLKPRCITRDLKWGTPVPLEGFTDKVFYVWFDAPIGYVSITASYTDQWEKWWKNPQQVEMYNFMAKDNVPFHSVVFPCTLLGTEDNFTKVNHLCATEYLNYEDDKFSKSRGVGVFGNDAQTTTIPADIWRFYLLYVRPESQDSTFSWDDFLLKNNSELLNNLGNFVNRALKFVKDSYGGVIPEMDIIDEDKTLLAQVTQELSSYVDKLEGAQLRDGIWHMLSMSRLGNQYFQSTMPWKLAKSGDPADKKRAATVVGVAANLACLLALLVHPYMPAVSQTMMEQLSVNKLWKLEKKFPCLLKPGHEIGSPFPLFTKIDPAAIADYKKRFAGTQAARSAPSKATSQPAPAADPVEAARLTKEVEAQGAKVRELKSQKAEKAAIDVEVSLLLDLKKKLSLTEGKSSEADKKSGKKGKGNQQTSEKKGQSQQKSAPPAGSSGDLELAKRLTAQVEAQGNKVREVKAAKSEKSVIDAEVSTLLQLKRELAVAEGRDPDAKPPKSKSKGKK